MTYSKDFKAENYLPIAKILELLEPLDQHKGQVLEFTFGSPEATATARSLLYDYRSHRQFKGIVPFRIRQGGDKESLQLVFTPAIELKESSYRRDLPKEASLDRLDKIIKAFLESKESAPKYLSSLLNRKLLTWIEAAYICSELGKVLEKGQGKFSQSPEEVEKIVVEAVESFEILEEPCSAKDSPQGFRLIK